MWFVLLYLIAHQGQFVSSDSFSPDMSDYDAYGIKIAANDVLFAQVDNSGQTFLVQFAPYNYTFDSLQCSFDFDDSTHYVYSVGVGQKQNSTTNPYFYYAGEVVTSGPIATDRSGHNGTYIGVWIDRDPQNIQMYSTTHQPLSCDNFETEQLQYLNSYGHQEFFTIAVEPYGQYAIGLATDFVFKYQPYPMSSIMTKASTQVWPNNSTFRPYAADASTTFTIVAGFVAGSARSRVRATPAVYLLWNSNLTVLSTWSYSATNNSWQSRLTYSNVESWSNQYIMSVKINPQDSTRVLVGMPFLNTVFLFVVINNTQLTLTSSLDNGQSVGFGKGVTWLSQTQAAILMTHYSLSYLTWYSTNIFIYTAFNDTTIPTIPSASFPNAQQPIPSTINSKLIRVISTPSTLAVLDTAGGVILILNEQPGFYASTDTTNSPVAAAMPVISHSTPCIAGTFKVDSGVHPCQLCLSGTQNSGGPNSGTSCTTCQSSSFCPLGAAYEINATLLTSISQAYAYPRSPDMTSYEDILLQQMFTLGSTWECLHISPVFWCLVLLGIIGVLLILMASLNLCVSRPKRDRYRTTIKNVFQRTDLVGEGELWLGGLASLAVVLISVMAYAFSVSYLNEYPAEKTNGSRFSCDKTLRNAQFDSKLEALAVPVSDEEQVIFDLLNEQNFTLQLDFVNTATSCQVLLIYEVTELSTTILPISSCSNQNGTLYATLSLPLHEITLRVVLSDIQLIGGFRVGISGPSKQNGTSTLKQLGFLRSFYSQSKETFAQVATLKVALTKAVNQTEPLANGDSEFEGLWYPTFTYSLDEMFITNQYYVTSANRSSTTLTIDISETSYYIKNTQSPIAKQAEIMFRTLLFTFLCLEICATIFVICKLLLEPIWHRLLARCVGQSENKIDPGHEMTFHNNSHH
ncbi:unnamed protein product [Adineta ricciae]|uniref:Transmembrane protein n=2 Tax=Adineta ricciae TaxID=249248 RepID=A0A815GNA6_ADIRI|nr:unnamed protein product [Adineta ricciae]CAF1340880.1 unnamed protein product [Adineta ricciae]